MRSRDARLFFVRRCLPALLLCAASAQAGELGHALRPQLGVAPDAELLAAAIGPDGAGLPQGRGSVAQGAQIYARACFACHGADGRQAGNALVGGRGSLATTRAFRTVGSYWPHATTLYDYVRRAMPYGNEKSLSDADVYAVVAYVLHLNDIVDADTVLNAQSLAKIEMPNRDGFRPAPDFAPYTQR